MPPTAQTRDAVPPPDPSADPGGGSAGSPAADADPPVVRARSARDLLAAVPHLLGYRPRESLVVVCVTDRQVVGLVARVGLDDLRGGSSGREGRGAVDRLVAAARRVGTAEIVAAVHTARDARTARRLVGPALAELALVGDVDPWLVAPEGYRGLDCTDPACCPPHGHPPADLEHRAVNAALALTGRAVASSADDAYRLPRVDDARRSRAARAATRAARAREAVREAPAAGAGATPRDHAARSRASGYDLWCDLVRHAARDLELGPGESSPTDLPPARLGRFAVALDDVAVRDAVLLSVIPGGDEPARRTVAGRDAPDEDAAGRAEVEVATARAIARVVDPRVAVLPDPGTAAAAQVVLEQLVAHVPRRWHAAPLTLLGLLAWWQGDGGLAAHRVAAAAEADPAYRLAALLDGVLAAAVPPGWVRAMPRGTGAGADGVRVG